AGLTTWELLVGPQASDVATSRLLVETWVTFMLVWAINNVLHCRLAAAGDDAKGLTWLVTASAFFVGAGVAYVPQFDTPTIWSVFASEACLAVGGVSILLALARYGAGVPPFTYPEVRRQLVHSAAVVLPNGLVCVMLGAFAFRLLTLQAAALLVIFAAAIMTHSWSDSRWRARILDGYDESERVMVLKGQVVALEHELARSHQDERQRMMGMLHDQVKNPLLRLASGLEDMKVNVVQRLMGDSGLPALEKMLPSYVFELRDAATKLENIVYASYTPELMVGDLHKAVRDLTDRSPLFTDFVGVSVEGLESLRDELFTPMIAQQMYSMICEGINNAAKHMPGCALELTGEADGETLEVEVLSRVDGERRKTNPLSVLQRQKKGVGIPTRREAFEALGGKVDFRQWNDGNARVACLRGSLPRTGTRLA